MQRDKYVRRPGWIDSEEVRRGYADDRERRAVDEDRLTNGAGALGKTAAPVTIGDHCHGRCAEAVVVLFDPAAGRGPHFQGTKKTARYELYVSEFCLVP